jgi:hypothetical protein
MGREFLWATDSVHSPGAIKQTYSILKEKLACSLHEVHT